MSKRTISQVEAEIIKARQEFDKYSKLQFEGHSNPDNYYLNPHHVTLDALAAELREIQKSEIEEKLTGDSLKAEQVWFNSQKFTRPDVAQKACRARGYNMDDLFAAIKKSK